MHNIPESDDLRKMGIDISNEFSRIEGRQPRILVANSSENTSFSTNSLSNILADMGFDVDIAPRLNTFKNLANQCIENDADILLICNNSQHFNIELSKIEQHLNSKNFYNILAIYLQDKDMTNSFVSKLKNWKIYDQTYNEESIAFDLIQILMNAS